MARRKPKLKNDSEEAPLLRFHELREAHKTWRCLIVSVAGVTGLGMVCWAAVQISQKSLWEALIGLVAMVLGLWFPVKNLNKMQGKFRLYMKNDHQRLCKLEVDVDPGRSTSGLNKDGTSSHGV